MKQAISVRRFSPADWPLYKSLRLRSLEESPDAFGSTLELECGRADAAWAERLHNAALSGRDCALFAQIEGVPSGLVWAKADASDTGCVNLFQLWVTPEARGRGVGDALLHAAIDWARQYGAGLVKLGATCGDTAAIRLYQRAGFVEVGDRELLRSGNALMAQNMVLALA